MTTRQRRITAIASKLLDWYPKNARDLPWRRTDDPYAIWVSEIMLQQTQVVTVIPYWERWMRELPTIRALGRAKPERIHKLWEGLGYYTRVRNMQQAAQMILQQRGGRFPTTFEEVLALPGIGRYTAGAICSIAFNQPFPILDGNVVRVLTRLFGIDGNPRESTLNARLWELSEQLVKQAHAASLRAQFPSTLPFCSHLNQSLMELGALVCVPRQPRCELCPVAPLCVARKQGRAEALPTPAPRTPATKRRFVAFVLKRQNKFLIRKRPAGVVNGHLWEFPNIEVSLSDGKPAAACLRALKFLPAKPKHLGTIKHTITRYRIRLDAFSVQPKHAEQLRIERGRWFDQRDLDRLPFTSAHKKILGFLDQTS